MPTRAGHGNIRLDFTRRVAGGFAVLERGQSNPMHGDVCIDRIRIQRLADDQTGLAMRISVRSQKPDVRR